MSYTLAQRLFRIRAALVTGLMLLSGCGGGTAPSPKLLPPAPGVSGTVTKGPLQQAVVSLYLQSGGVAAGDSLATATTDDAGRFTLPSLEIPPGTSVLLARACGGSFVDESDTHAGEQPRRRIVLTAAQCLEAPLIYSPAGSVIVITPYTAALLQKARRQFQAQELWSFEDVLLGVQVQAIEAFGFDPFTVTPANPLAPVGNDDQRQYALLLGGAAQAINAVATGDGRLPGYQDVLAFIDDFSDGRLDLASLGTETRRFRNNNAGHYADLAPVVVDEALLEQPAVPGAPPVNDRFADARDIGGEARIVGSTAGAGSETGEPLGNCRMGSSTVWFRWTPARSGTHVGFIDTGRMPLGFDTVVAVYTGDSLTTLVSVACNDDSVDLISALAFDVTGGQTYWIQLGGYSNNQAGPFELWVSYDDDRDQLSDLRERSLGTNPASADTDGDGVTDLDELLFGDGYPYDYQPGRGDYNPADPASRPPLGAPDAYAVPQGGQFEVSGSGGVLGNDPVAGAAVLYWSPSHGTLQLAADGSFVYVHDGASVDSDHFGYRSCDATSCGNPVEVTLYINAAQSSIDDLAGHWQVLPYEGGNLTSDTTQVLPRSGSLSFLPGNQYLLGTVAEFYGLPAADPGCAAGLRDSDVSVSPAGDQLVAGVEYGGYAWSPASAEFSVARPLLLETDGNCGLNLAPDDATNKVRSLALAPGGGRLTFIDSDRKARAFVRSYSAPGEIRGAFIVDGSLSAGAPRVVSFEPYYYGTSSGRYLLVDATGEADPGIEYGCYAIGTQEPVPYWQTTVDRADCPGAVDTNGLAGYAGLAPEQQARFGLTQGGLEFTRQGVVEQVLSRLVGGGTETPLPAD